MEAHVTGNKRIMDNMNTLAAQQYTPPDRGLYSLPLHHDYPHYQFSSPSLPRVSSDYRQLPATQHTLVEYSRAKDSSIDPRYTNTAMSASNGAPYHQPLGFTMPQRQAHCLPYQQPRSWYPGQEISTEDMDTVTTCQWSSLPLGWVQPMARHDPQRKKQRASQVNTKHHFHVPKE